jgi:hypothetical protein
MNYVFWLRNRDDALVPDLVPAFVNFQVINPRYERDVVVLDFTALGANATNTPVTTPTFSTKMYWKEAVDSWAQSTGREIEFDTVFAQSGVLAESFSAPDYFVIPRMISGAPISELLKHKLMILYNDNVGAPPEDKYRSVFKALDAGINVWLTMRVPLHAASFDVEDLDIAVPFGYTWYFGVERTAFSGWLCHLFTIGPTYCDIKGYFQDFIGTITLKPENEWPSLHVDRDLLYNRYNWFKGQPLWYEPQPALPEVNWSQTAFGTEVIYLYKSIYGQSHPLDARYAFQGRPVGHRYETSLFRTVHFNFTPLSIDAEEMQGVVDSVLNWLYDPNLASPVAGTRYIDAPVKVTIDQARANAKRRDDEYNALQLIGTEATEVY